MVYSQLSPEVTAKEIREIKAAVDELVFVINTADHSKWTLGMKAPLYEGHPALQPTNTLVATVLDTA